MLESSDRDSGPTNALMRLVIIADNSLILEAFRLGLRRSKDFDFVGHADGRRTSARAVVGAKPDVILLDEMDRSSSVIDLVRGIRGEDPVVAIIVMSLQMDPEWLDHLFTAGATAAISKAVHPVALATLVRETVNGHILHSFARPMVASNDASTGVVAGDLPLTERELEILRLVAAGSTNGDVARRLWVTEQTVKFHLRNIYRKLDVANRTQASHVAHLSGLLDTALEAEPQPEITVAS